MRSLRGHIPGAESAGAPVPRYASVARSEPRRMASAHSQGERQGRPRRAEQVPSAQPMDATPERDAGAPPRRRGRRHPLRWPIPLRGPLGPRCGAPSPGKPRPDPSLPTSPPKGERRLELPPLPSGEGEGVRAGVCAKNAHLRRCAPRLRSGAPEGGAGSARAAGGCDPAGDAHDRATGTPAPRSAVASPEGPLLRAARSRYDLRRAPRI